MITADRLRLMLDYDPETGIWTWIDPPKHNRDLLGKEAGYVRKDGYRLIRIGGTAYYSSRLACLYMTGEWPVDEMDHIDREPSNDQWDNLRETNSSGNKFNQGRWVGASIIELAQVT